MHEGGEGVSTLSIGLYFLQMSQNRVCIRSVFEKKMGPYEVCIFVNTGPFEETAALHKSGTMIYDDK